jgi:hypothetical protein
MLDFNPASRVGDPVMTASGTPPSQAPDVDYTEWDVHTDLSAVASPSASCCATESTRTRAAGR